VKAKHIRKIADGSSAFRNFKPVRYGAVLMALVTLASLSACASSAPPVSNGSGGSLTGTLTIGDWEFLEAGNGPRLESAVTAYEKTHPGAKIEAIGIPSDSYGSTIDTELSAHKGPDILVIGGGTSLYDLAPANLLSPITLTPTETKSLIPQNSQGIISGQRYAVVWEFNENDLLYNRQLFKQAGISAPPTNFNSFLSDCMTIKQKTGQYGFTARNMLNEEPLWYSDYTLDWLAGFGGSWSNAQGQFTVDSPASVTALTDFKKVYDSGCMATGQTATVFRPEFEAGKIGMLIDNIDAAYTYTAANKTLTNTTMGGAPIPFPAHHSGSSAIMLGINRYAPNQALAENFVQWLMSPAGQQSLVPGIEPNQAGTTAASMPQAFVASHGWVQPFLAEGKAGPQVLNLNGNLAHDSTPFSDMIMPYIEKVLQNQLTPSEALQEAQEAAIRQFSN
jgi:ABC-type glycerol-3-phosphate transport system substrate-binding protein